MARRNGRKLWEMPSWMKPYEEWIANTGGNSIEDCMNGVTDPLVNLPLSTIEFGVKSQVTLLTRLNAQGLLKAAPEKGAV